MRTCLGSLIILASFAPTLYAQSATDDTIYRDQIKSYALRHAKADQIVSILNEQFPDFAKFSVNSATNTLYARVPQAAESEVNRFIDVLEEAAAKSAAAEAERKTLEEKRRADALSRAGPFVHPNAADGKSQQEYFDPFAADAVAQAGPFAHPNAADRKSQQENFDPFAADGDSQPASSGPQQDASQVARTRYEMCEREAAKLADRYRRAKSRGRSSEDGLSDLRARIQELISEAFIYRQRMKRNDLAKASAQLQAIRERLEARYEIMDQIVQRRLEELLSGVDLSWLSDADREQNEALAAAEFAAPKDDEVTVMAKDASAAQQLLSQLTETKSNVQIQSVPELGTLIIRGRKEDVGKVVELFESVEDANRGQQIRGKILKLNTERGTILLDIGSDQGLQRDVPIEVVRDGKRIGQLQVVSIGPKDSIARVVGIQSEKQVAVGDEVRTGGKSK